MWLIPQISDDALKKKGKEGIFKKLSKVNTYFIEAAQAEMKKSIKVKVNVLHNKLM